MLNSFKQGFVLEFDILSLKIIFRCSDGIHSRSRCGQFSWKFSSPCKSIQVPKASLVNVKHHVLTVNRSSGKSLLHSHMRDPLSIGLFTDYVPIHGPWFILNFDRQDFFKEGFY